MKVYFKNLDGVRCIAAVLVLLHHAQHFKTITDPTLSSVFKESFKNIGSVGVNLFFVLSGFLISYLLMVEQKNTTTINVKNFYIRRILRIWPLYFAYGLGIILVSPFLFKALGIHAGLPAGDVITNIIYLLLFAVNFQFVFLASNPGMVEILWSVCVEEQFYLLWPVLVRKFKFRYKTLITYMLIIGALSKIILYIIVQLYGISMDYMLLFNYVMLTNKVELFAAGMLGAYLFFNKESFPAFFRTLQNKWVQVLILVAAFYFSFTNFYMDKVTAYFFSDFSACLFYSLFILSVVQSASIVNFEFPLFRLLGKVSYAIYLFHPPVCQLTLLLMLKVVKIPNSFWTYDLLYPVLCLAITATLAYLSYELYEKRFLKLKNKFASVKTGI